ncbi:hypothetical protein ACYJ1Y_11170 [Natrialbaceae archaeon A-gly3]
MTATTRPVLVITVLVVTSLTVAPALAASAVADEDPETADDYFQTFRSLDGTDAFEEYDEMETLRTFAVTQTQESGTLDDDERAEFDAVLETMDAFETAYENAEDEEYAHALENASDTETAITALEGQDETQATLATLALTRFYEDLGGDLEEMAEDADRTPDEIEYLTMAATAYEGAGATGEAAEFRQQAEQRTAEYERDLEVIDATEEESAAFLDECVDCSAVTSAIGGNFLETFSAYGDAQTHYAAMSDAEQRADVHGLDEREGELSETVDELGETRMNLALASTTMLLGYGLVVGLFGTIVFSRVFAWKRTYDKAQVGSVVQIGDSDV